MQTIKIGLVKLSMIFFIIFNFHTSFAQDTTWVQTLTFDSIATRRAVFDFPESLNNKRFEKVLMYYKLKCSPLTPWDQYDCGEWDYLAYSRIFEHTGIFDSTQVLGNKYSANFNSPNSISFDAFPFSRKDSYVRMEKNRSGALLTSSPINTANTTSKFPFNVENNGGRFQYLLSAAELIAAGVIAGDIQSLSLYVNSLSVNGEIKYPTISLKSTQDLTLVAMHQTGFTEVYNASHWSNGSQSEFVTGQNELLFHQPFNWNGTDNLLVEFFYENSEDSENTILFDAEDVSTNVAMGFDSQNGVLKFDGTAKVLSEKSDFNIGNEVTIAFWSKGTGSAGTNTIFLEALDTLGNRVLNIHFPWSDNNLYFDAGGSGGYDRINKLMTAAEIDNNWNHWALTKNVSNGQMKIYKNGALWHSGTGKTIPIGYIHRMVLGSNLSDLYSWNGKIDEFQIYNTALTQANIQAWMNKKIDNTHPNFNNLVLYHDFDNKKWAEDMSVNDNLLMPSEFGMFQSDEFPLVSKNQLTNRPVMAFGQGTVSGSLVESEHLKTVVKEPTVIFEYEVVGRHYEIVNATVGQASAEEITYDANNQVISSTSFVGATTITNSPLNYYNQPVEEINNIEIGRYITPYGIGFDLGANGFNYIYDVTDYQQYLKNSVDLEAHNTQELIDLKFVFIEGIPPRDVHNRQPIWEESRIYRYSEMDNNTVLPAVGIQLADTSEMFKIRTRFTGHGHNGTVNCCEWDSKDHQISINGVPRFNWEIWQESECGDNPNISQGGTWPYAREGWCPGDMVKEHDHEVTPFVSSGQLVTIDYDIENVPTNDQGQGNGDYVVAMDLISYSSANFQNDAAILDVLNPNNYEYYQKFNPTCSYPRVILQNTGALPLTSCTLRIYIDADKTIDYPWSGNLPFLQKEIVEIPITDLTWWQTMSAGQQTFHAEILNVNGSADEYAFNNIKNTKFEAPELITSPFFVWLTTNNKASENKYTLIKDNGDVVFTRQNMTNTTQYKDTFDLEPGCYSIIIEDSDNDGLSFWYSAIPTSQGGEGETSGSLLLRSVGGSVIESFPRDFGNFHRYNFSYGLETLGTNKEITSDANIFIFPNPSEGDFYIDLGGKINNFAQLEVIDLSGRIILTEQMKTTQSTAESTINLKNSPAGIYFVKITTENGVYTKQLIKK